MKIGCLGWGSLVWNPRGLPVRGLWFFDGPFLPIEFMRQSSDDRITLVLCDGVTPVRSLWALMSVNNPDEAKKALAEREGINEKYISKYIGVWSEHSSSVDGSNQIIGEWTECMALDAVIWTALPPKFDGKDGKKPSADEVISHLSSLEHEKRKRAEEYVRMTPRQIDTDYRRQIEAVLHWTPLS
jgi:hypothetical protein